MYEQPIVYGVKYTDEERRRSQSGGAFAAISDFVIRRSGVIYGCSFNNRFEAVHTRAETSDERDRMRYSKYVQSDMNSVMKDIVEDLNNGRMVLFSGTSCQVAGVRSYISMTAPKAKGDLICVDIVCHGVPSPMVWRDYLAWEKERKGDDISKVICRNKNKHGWHSHVVTIKFSDNKELDSRVFPKIFYSHNALRPSCYKCPYKNIVHPGDITIADYWGVEKAIPGYDDDKGVSLLLINNDKGKEFFDECMQLVEYREAKIEDSMQIPLVRPYDAPETRSRFWNDYNSRSFTYIAKRYGGYGLVARVKRKAKTLLKV